MYRIFDLMVQGWPAYRVLSVLGKTHPDHKLTVQNVMYHFKKAKEALLRSGGSLETVKPIDDVPDMDIQARLVQVAERQYDRIKKRMEHEELVRKEKPFYTDRSLRDEIKALNEVYKTIVQIQQGPMSSNHLHLHAPDPTSRETVMSSTARPALSPRAQENIAELLLNGDITLPGFQDD